MKLTEKEIKELAKESGITSTHLKKVDTLIANLAEKEIIVTLKDDEGEAPIEVIESPKPKKATKTKDAPLRTLMGQKHDSGAVHKSYKMTDKIEHFKSQGWFVV